MISSKKLLNRAKTIIPESENQQILDHIKGELYTATNKASNDIIFGLKDKTETSTGNTLHSGSFVRWFLDFMAQTIIESCHNLLNNIEALQTSWNRTFSNKMLDTIAELTKKYYQGLLDSVGNKSLQGVISVANPPSGSTDSQVNILRQNINGMVDSKIKEIKVTNKVAKDAPSVRVSKRANIIATIAIIISGVSLYFSLRK